MLFRNILRHKTKEKVQLDIDDAKRKKQKLCSLNCGEEFYWDSFQCFGGEVVKQISAKETLIIDYGCDGNQYNKRVVKSSTRVWVERRSNNVLS